MAYPLPLSPVSRVLPCSALLLLLFFIIVSRRFASNCHFRMWMCSWGLLSLFRVSPNAFSLSVRFVISDCSLYPFPYVGGILLCTRVDKSTRHGVAHTERCSRRTFHIRGWSVMNENKSNGIRNLMRCNLLCVWTMTAQSVAEEEWTVEGAAHREKKKRGSMRNMCRQHESWESKANVSSFDFFFSSLFLLCLFMTLLIFFSRCRLENLALRVDFNRWDFFLPLAHSLSRHESIFSRLFDQKLLCLREKRGRVDFYWTSIECCGEINFKNRFFSHSSSDLHHIHGSADGQPMSIKSEAMTFNNNMMTMDYQSIQQLASMMPSTAPLLNPIDRLYSMQNQYFCTETAAQNMQTHHQMCE